MVHPQALEETRARRNGINGVLEGIAGRGKKVYVGNSMRDLSGKTMRKPA